MQQRRKELTFWGPVALLVLCFGFMRLIFDPPTSDDNSPALVLLQSELAESAKDMKAIVRLSPIVAQALSKGKPIVALESTVVTHGGLGYPRNLETARALEDAVRAAGAIPATIAIMDGAIRVGLVDAELDALAKTTKAVKCSKRDLGAAVALKWTGSTTVAATMYAAYLAGIEIFATGGIGGVHRGAFSGPSTLDVSADLTELSKTPVTVVCAGVKSILDVRGTLEWLETSGVPVAALNSDSFPQFFSAATDERTRVPAPLNLKSVSEVANVMRVTKLLGIKSGMILAVPNANPVPGIEAIVEKALQESEHVKGKDITPFVLKRVAELTEGKSVLSNIELLKNNAKIAGELAVEYWRLNQKTDANL